MRAMINNIFLNHLHEHDGMKLGVSISLGHEFVAHSRIRVGVVFEHLPPLGGVPLHDMWNDMSYESVRG